MLEILYVVLLVSFVFDIMSRYITHCKQKVKCFFMKIGYKVGM